MCNPDGKVSPIQWQSRQIHRVVYSSLAGECLALEEAAETCFWIQSLLTQLLPCEHKEIPIECVADKQSLLETICSTKNIQDKRLKVDIAIFKKYAFHREDYQGQVDQVIITVIKLSD